MQRALRLSKLARPLTPWGRGIHSTTFVDDLSPDASLVGPDSVSGHVSDWHLRELVSQGDLFRIYRAAKQPGAGGSEVALKVMMVSASTAAEEAQLMDVLQERSRVARARLEREAAVLQVVQHPRLRWLVADGLGHRPGYLAFPWINGESLAHLLRNAWGPQPTTILRLPQVLWIGRQMAEALAALHAAGWVHRQVHPAHILVQKTSGAILLDLTQASIVETDDCIATEVYSGAIEYAAPELLITGSRLDGSVDVYALGAVLFHALAGRVPFVGAGFDEIALGHIRESAPDVRQYHYQAPLRLAQLLRQTMAKDPLRRPTASELVDRLVDIEISALSAW